MNSFLDFFSIFKKSIFDPEFYRNLLNKERLGFSFSYFSFLIVLFSLLSTFFFVSFYIPMLQSSTVGVLESITSQLTDESNLIIQDGKFSIENHPSSVTVPFSKLFLNNQDNTYKNFLILDPSSKFDKSSLERLDTAVWVTKENIAINESGEEVLVVRSLDEVTNFNISKEEIEGYVKEIDNPGFWRLALISAILFISVFIGSFIYYLIYSIFLAILILPFIYIFTNNFSYTGLYQVSLHALTIAVLLNLISTIFGFSFLPFLPTLIAVILVSFNLKFAYEKIK